MKFVHIADMHFDSPFKGLSDIGTLGSTRRLEQRRVFKKVIEYIKENNIDYLFIVGDLYENEYVKKSTIEYINSLFKEIPDTKIIITPGNHDPYIKNSYYKRFDWNENVYICKEKIEVLQEGEIDFYMTAFTDFYMDESPINEIGILDSNKINILISHCDLNGSKSEDGLSYNPILESKINNLNFNYVALGHIHKSNYMFNKKIIYPGSPISFGFDELGDHGMITGEVDKTNLKIDFIKLDDRMFKKYEFDVSEIFTQEDFIEKILEVKFDSSCMYEIELIGDRNFDIKPREILKLIGIENVLKVKDCTQIPYNIEELVKENNLRGIFIREILKKYEDNIYTDEQIKKAIELGLKAIE